ncbi:CatB-related O-acetyltransferase [Aureliella helgolandensis]|uniref:Virginiamycin A acetyltransferase n=1 Tax=Aureliella helgolandensis TaxID=2527968 RepID=A0A518GFD9_9BACT|nr:CatB-related O-acetyltransferase [Aureliella helgolandensis]QDV27315.1 Virginiamycin A acetyltransferase [Aureliella helgolandensis]
MDANSNSSWPELKQSRTATALFQLAGMLRLCKRWTIARHLITSICKLEGGETFSPTARKFLANYYGVHIGSYSYGGVFKPGAFPAKTYVGRYSSIAAGVRCIERNHPYNRVSTSSFFYEPNLGIVSESQLPAYEPIYIGHDVWIGWNAILLPGCRRIGNGAIIGAGAIVTSNVPPYAIVAGSPAKILKYRFNPELIESLEATNWWQLTPQQLREHRELFCCTIDMASISRLAACGTSSPPTPDRRSVSDEVQS